MTVETRARYIVAKLSKPAVEDASRNKNKKKKQKQKKRETRVSLWSTGGRSFPGGFRRASVASRKSFPSRAQLASPPTSVGESCLERTCRSLCASTNQFCNEGSLRCGAPLAFPNLLWAPRFRRSLNGTRRYGNFKLIASSRNRAAIKLPALAWREL